jgi:hypothetical protein
MYRFAFSWPRLRPLYPSPLPDKEPAVPIEEEEGWVPEPVSTIYSWGLQTTARDGPDIPGIRPAIVYFDYIVKFTT